MRLVRRILVYLIFLLGLPVLLTHRKLRPGLRYRLGLYPRAWPRLGPGPRVWLHGASAGDMLALKPLAIELRRRAADAAIIASTITDSGRAMAARLGSAFDVVTFAPYDLPGAVHRALRRLQPRVLVLEYTELWPELIDDAHRAGVKLVLHNGRFSADKLARYRRLFAVTGNLLDRFELLLMRDEFEADRALTLGADPARVAVTGNTKFDNLDLDLAEDRRRDLRAALGFDDGALLLVAGSTHEGEEELLLDTYKSLRRRAPALRLIVAPRYTDRAPKVASLAARKGLAARLRTTPPAPSDVVVLDTIGELALCYSLAEIVFVGGSFVKRGGQNILEPAACGKPVLFGPYMANFADAVLVLLGRGGLQVGSAEQLERVLADLIERESYRHELGELARSQVMGVRGAARRNAELIAALL